MKLKRISIFVLCFGMIFGAFNGLTIGSSYAANPISVQLISDQLTAVPGGEISYHIIYHNVGNKNISNTQLKVMIPEGFEPQSVDGADWNASTKVLVWNIKDIDANGANVIHFNLMVKDNVKYEQFFEFTCTVEVEGKIVSESEKVKLKIGTEIHQPVFNGYPDGLFRPTRNLSRSEAAAVISRVKNLEDETTTEQYVDVPKEHWAYHYINKVTKAGYMVGNNSQFRPEDPISRAEFVVILLRLRGIDPVPLVGFDDTVGHWANLSIATAKKLYFIDGLPGNVFGPDQYVERQTAAKLLSIALYRGQLHDGAETVIEHWPDVKRTAWSFGWIAETSMLAHESEHKGRWNEKLIQYLPEQTEPF